MQRAPLAGLVVSPDRITVNWRIKESVWIYNSICLVKRDTDRAFIAVVVIQRAPRHPLYHVKPLEARA